MNVVIPPVDGAIHVAQGETVGGIAGQYGAQPAALYAANHYPRDPGYIPNEGAQVFIPGGQGAAVEWNPPQDWAMTAVGDVRANPEFLLPTGSRAVSGWTFHDPVNPYHIGLDYACTLGSSIRAANNGVAVHSGWAGGYGNLIILDHGNGYRTYYAHLELRFIQLNERVSAGTTIGTCGNTGRSTGPHLHYETRYNGKPQNPALFEP